MQIKTYVPTYIERLLTLYHYVFRKLGIHSNVIYIMYPYILYPGWKICMCCGIFMTVAISFERYIAICHPTKV